LTTGLDISWGGSFYVTLLGQCHTGQSWSLDQWFSFLDENDNAMDKLVPSGFGKADLKNWNE